MNENTCKQMHSDFLNITSSLFVTAEEFNICGGGVITQDWDFVFCTNSTDCATHGTSR